MTALCYWALYEIDNWSFWRPKNISHVNLVFIHSSWLTAPQTLESSGAIKARGASLVIIFGLLSSVPEIVSEPERCNGCLLIHSSSFQYNLIYVNELTFGKHLRRGTGRPGELTKWLKGQKFRSYFPNLQGGERGLRLSSITSDW